jgi:hypothetical protein
MSSPATVPDGAAAQAGQSGTDQGSIEAFFEVVEEASGQDQVEGAAVGGQVMPGGAGVSQKTRSPRRAVFCLATE